MSRLLGIDTGGTFTDFVLFDGRSLRIHKELSTPDAPERAILRGMAALDLVPGAPEPEGTEVLSLRHLPFADALQMVANGEITDAISVMAILHYQRLSNQSDQTQPRLAANLTR